MTYRRVAAIYDIHGNLPALESVLREIRDADVDCVVVGGDVVPGPMPHEALATLFSLEIPTEFIFGNGETEVLRERRGEELIRVPEAFRSLIHWTARQLHPDDEARMTTWPATTRLEIAGLGQVLFCHATPRSDVEIFTRLTPEDRLRPLFEGIADVVVCGHTHMQFDRTVGRTRVANAGSVGMPWAPPGAYWLLLGPGIELRKTSYDLTAAAARIRATTYPHADEFAERNVLRPPAEADMLAAYAGVELKD
jgi:predicted phosphodiesterase